MINARSISFAALLVTCGVVACSSDDNSASGGASQAKSSMSQTATAELTKSNGSSAFKSANTQKSSGGFSPFGGSSGGSATSSTAKALAIRTIRPLAEGGASGCADIDANKEAGSCSCPGGGSVDYAISDIAAMKGENFEGEINMSFSFSQCKDDDQTLDGKMVMIQSKKTIIDKASWLPAGAPKAESLGDGTSMMPNGMNLLWSAEQLSNGKETLDFSLLIQDGETCMRPPADGGFFYLCIGAKGFAIYAKNGAFSCDFAKGECTGSEETAKIALEGFEPMSGGDTDPTDPPTNPTDPTDPEGITCGQKTCGANQFCCYDAADTCVDEIGMCPEPN